MIKARSEYESNLSTLDISIVELVSISPKPVLYQTGGKSHTDSRLTNLGEGIS